MIVYLSRLVASPDLQAARRVDGRRRFDVEHPRHREPLRDGRQQRIPVGGAKGRVEKDHVERPLLARKETARVSAMRLECRRAQCRAGGNEPAHDSGVMVDGDAKCGASRQCFEGQRTAAGKQIQRLGSRKVLSQPVEKSLANPIGCRPEAGNGREA